MAAAFSYPCFSLRETTVQKELPYWRLRILSMWSQQSVLANMRTKAQALCLNLWPLWGTIAAPEIPVGLAKTSIVTTLWLGFSTSLQVYILNANPTFPTSLQVIYPNALFNIHSANNSIPQGIFRVSNLKTITIWNKLSNYEACTVISAFNMLYTFP